MVKAHIETDAEYEARVLKREYEEICELIWRDHPKAIHEEIVKRLGFAVQCLQYVTEEVDQLEFDTWQEGLNDEEDE